MKHIASKSSAHAETVGPFNIFRAFPNAVRQAVGPVIFLDHFPETDFPPGKLSPPDGSFAHPHRGIATFTYVIKGAIHHLDSNKGQGVVAAGGVQWMNAGNGIVHDEGFTPELRDNGGTLYSFQFWVNLPAKNKAEAPDYMPVQSDDLPVVLLPEEAGVLKVLLGKYEDKASPIPAFTEQFIWHIHLHAGQIVELPTTSSYEYAGYLPSGIATVNTHTIKTREFFDFEQNNAGIRIENPTDSSLDILIFGGEPYQEPVVSHGPFVMNTQDEIVQAYGDYRKGKYGQIDYDSPITNITKYI